MNANHIKRHLTIWDTSALIYLTIPLLMFVWGWLKLWIAIPIILLIIFSTCKLIYQTVNIKSESNVSINFQEIIPALLIFVLYIFLTGMTGNWAQHSDYYVRNDIFWDLTTKPWPPTLSDGRYFVYYFQSWLPAASIGSSLGWKSALWGYFIWSCIGIIISLHYIFKVSGKTSFWIACVFFSWNGLELIPCAVISPLLQDLHIKEAFMLNEHVAGHFLTEAPCFSMKNIVHCFIPLSIIGGMLFQSENVKKFSPTLGILAVMYSPMSSIFLLPILLYIYFREYISITPEGNYLFNWRYMVKNAFSLYNISYILPFILLIIPFYISTKSIADVKLDLLFKSNHILLYFFYLFFNCIITVVLIRRNVKTNLLWIIFFTHAICILSGLIFHDDIAMKGSVMTTYFLIILYCKAFVREKTRFKIAYVLYSILGIQYFIHMTGALLCVLIGIFCWLLLRLKISHIAVAVALLSCLFVVVVQQKPSILSTYKDKLSGKYTCYHKHMGIFQKDGGSGLWWWYRTFPHRADMPLWFK